MKIILNCLIRNERAHAESAMAHFTSLFDEINIVDHKSDDGTLDAVLGWNSETCRVNGFGFDNPGYFQSELMTYFARTQVAEAQADWVFFLDFDEYLPFSTRKEFEQSLVQHKFDPVIKLRWHNLIPVAFGNPHHLGAEYLVPPHASPYVKCAIQPKMLKDYPDIVIEQGNHTAVTHPGGEEIEAEFAFGLFHIPVDSEEQLRAKIEAGAAAYKAHWEAGNTELGKHWVLMGEALDKSGAPENLLEGFIAHYGEDDVLSAMAKGEIGAIGDVESARHLYRQIKLDVAGLNSEPSGQTADPVKRLSLSQEGVVACSPAPCSATVSHQDYCPASGIKAAALPEANECLKGVAQIEGLDQFLARSLDQIKVVTPSAWGGHIPFMFALIETLRPRRFAELGSHYGASFFAACQAAKKLSLPSDFIAIDLWEGDPQAGFYGEEVYSAFELNRTKHFADIGRSIRSYFADAAPHFENKSLDLIHIDGLHTYEAVKEDYETWRPKLTDNGVIIFHDTNEYQTDFGVWDFFSSIRNEATASFEFKHTHGLGVMAFGDPTKNPMIRVLEMMNAEPVKTEQHFARQGELVVTEARFAVESMNARKAANAQDEIDQTARVGSLEVTDDDLLNTRTKVLFRLILRRYKLRQERKRMQRAHAAQ